MRIHREKKARVWTATRHDDAYLVVMYHANTTQLPPVDDEETWSWCAEVFLNGASQVILWHEDEATLLEMCKDHVALIEEERAEAHDIAMTNRIINEEE